MFDLTKEIKLEKKWQRTYNRLRLLLFLIFILISLILIHRILFPSASFVFFFQTPNATKNSIINPRDVIGKNYTNGNISADKNLLFNASLIGDFSRSSIHFNLNKNNQLGGKIEIRKSYQAFFYPLSKPLDFKNGTLLKNNEEYYMISDGAIRKFSSLEILEKLGFKKEAFLNVSTNDLLLNSVGLSINDYSHYPADSLFRILDEYYQLKNNSLIKFVSENAYLTHYKPEQAIEKNISFFDKYPPVEDYLGFADGTLLASGISVYIVSGKNAYPVNNPVTFESMGYNWSDVLDANSEEIGIYEKKKLFTIDSPHPKGTIFYTQDSKKYFYVTEDIKREITSPVLLATYQRKNPIMVTEKSLTEKISCKIQPTFKFFDLYHCDAELSVIKSFPGNNYQFITLLEKNTAIDTLSIEFNQVFTWENMKKSLFLLKNRIANNYITQ